MRLGGSAALSRLLRPQRQAPRDDGWLFVRVDLDQLDRADRSLPGDSDVDDRAGPEALALERLEPHGAPGLPLGERLRRAPPRPAPRRHLGAFRYAFDDEFRE